MAKWKQLLEKLERVRELQRGATSPGEFKAASAAILRLQRRIESLEASDPVRAHYREMVHTPSLPPVCEPIFSGEMPADEEVLDALSRYEQGNWTRRELRNWAIERSDAVVVPADAEESGAFVGEVLLHLASHQTGLRPEDVSGIRQAWTACDWGAWFSIVANGYARASPRRPDRVFS